MNSVINDVSLCIEPHTQFQCLDYQNKGIVFLKLAQYWKLTVLNEINSLFISVIEMILADWIELTGKVCLVTSQYSLYHSKRIQSFSIVKWTIKVRKSDKKIGGDAVWCHCCRIKISNSTKSFQCGIFSSPLLGDPVWFQCVCVV